jgi:sugar lactone lactonase YvrE
VATDSSGNVYVADTRNNTIRQITPAGVVTTLAGGFNSPFGVATDSSGNVYVADTVNHTIRKITPAGVVTTLAGLAGNPGSADGTGSAARFNIPSAVATDSSGNVYVADNQNYTIRQITPAGVVTTLAGLAGSRGTDDGTGSAARFFEPLGLATDSSGNVYVADTSNNMIRKGFLPPQLTILLSGVPPSGIVLTWPTNAVGFTLQSTTNLVSPVVWSTNSPAPVVIAGQNTVTNPITGPQQFFRLVQ